MLTPHEFFSRFKQFGNPYAQEFFQRLPEKQIGWLIEGDEEWPLLEHWMNRQKRDGLDPEVFHDMQLPELVCRECTDFTRPEESDPFCMKWGKTIPERILPTGCKEWRPS